MGRELTVVPCSGEYPPPFWSQQTTNACLDYCDVCNSGTMMMTDTDTTVIPLVNMSCAEAAVLADVATTPDNYCSALTAISFDVCQCDVGDGTKPFICSACPGNGMVTMPDATVDLSSIGFVGTANCFDLQAYAPYVAAYYGIDRTSCSFLQAMISGPCGCEAAPSSPSSSVADDGPTAAPATTPTDAPAGTSAGVSTTTTGTLLPTMMMMTMMMITSVIAGTTTTITTTFF